MDINTLIINAIDNPATRVDREQFLRETLFKYKPNLSKEEQMYFVDNPVRAIGITEVNYIADKVIKSAVLQTAGLSFLAGLPGGVWGIAAAGPDIVQNLAYYIILSQKLAYVYGVNFYETAFPTDSEYQKSSTLLCLGFMLGVNDVDSLIQKVLGGAWKNSGKEFVEFLMKTAGFALARKILTSIGERLANKGATNVLGKAVPLLGGLLSGGMTFADFKKSAARMQQKLVAYNEDLSRGL